MGGARFVVCPSPSPGAASPRRPLPLRGRGRRRSLRLGVTSHRDFRRKATPMGSHPVRQGDLLAEPKRLVGPKPGRLEPSLGLAAEQVPGEDGQAARQQDLHRPAEVEDVVADLEEQAVDERPADDGDRPAFDSERRAGLLERRAGRVPQQRVLVVRIGRERRDRAGEDDPAAASASSAATPANGGRGPPPRHARAPPRNSACRRRVAATAGGRRFASAIMPSAEAMT